VTELYAIILFITVLLFLLGTGVWVGLALMGVAWFGMELFTTRPVGDAMVTTIWASSSSWTLTALPLFIWMGEILFRTRLSEDMFKGLSPWLAKLPGGLVHTNIVGCTVFAAVSGSSAATLSTVGKMSIPELRARNYPEKMIIGTLAGAATLGLMIPPSLALIVYGVTVNESITELFFAGVLPGLILALMFMAYVAFIALTSKDWNPSVETGMSFAAKLRNSRFLLPVFGLITVVIGSMYLGYATATEAAAIGVLGSLALALMQGSLNWTSFQESLMGAMRTSAMIALILAGAAFLKLSMGFTGLPRALADGIAALELTRFQLLMALLVFYIVLGMFLDGISSVVLTMAVVEPMVRGAGIDLIWFGIFVVVVVEMAQITPPIGFNLFVLQGMTDHEMGYITKAALPMFLIMVVMVFVLIFFPRHRDLAARKSKAGAPMTDFPLIQTVGLSGVLVRFADTMSEPANRAALSFRAAVDAADWPEVTETSTSLVSTFLQIDLVAASVDTLLDRLHDLLATRDWYTSDLPTGRTLWHVPTVYGTDLAPQLEEAAELAGLDPDAAIAQLSQARVRVLTIGFAPGQPYMGELPQNWDIPRQQGLTKSVPAGALIVAIRQLIIFTNASPTGWRHIGQTAFKTFRPRSDTPFALSPGDELCFPSISRAEYDKITATDETGQGGAETEVLA